MDHIAARTSSNKRTILVVEDEKLMLHLLAKIFLQQGYQVMVASDGEQAIEIYRRWRLKIDIVLLDVGLPKMTGWQVLSKMKQENPEVRVVVATGYLEPEKKVHMSRVGVKDFVTKPYRLDQVIKTIQSVIDGQ
jgi:two-component system cell cycle sensor histidine kinase/response regulator CckA